MSAETWITLALGTVGIPSVAWLVREVLSLRGTMIAIEARMAERDRNCERHQKWNDALQRSVNRVDRNVARLCQKAGVQDESD